MLESEKGIITEHVASSLMGKDSLSMENSLFRRKMPIDIKKTLSEIDGEESMLRSQGRQWKMASGLQANKNKNWMINSEKIIPRLTENKK